MTETRRRIALIGDAAGSVTARPWIEAIAPQLGATEWIPSTEITSPQRLAGFTGLWVTPGSPYHSRDGVLMAIQYAREAGIPYLGTCGGFKHVIVEYARNVLGMGDAEDAQYNPEAEHAVIVPTSCSLIGKEGTLYIRPGTRIAAAIGRAGQLSTTYHCDYGVNPDFADLLTDGPLRVSAWDQHNEPRAVEIDSHPFFIATLFQPELSSTPDSIHPLITAFARAAHKHPSSSHRVPA